MTEREMFEAHWHFIRGNKSATRELQRHPEQPQTYVQDNANRHWVTWQAAVASANQALQAKPVEPDGPVKVHMRCQDCGHDQTVRGNRLNGATYFGSGYDFCDKCDGPPRLIPDIQGHPV